MRAVTLCFPVAKNPTCNVLLGYKRRGFGAGKYAGFGGKVEPDESPRQAAARELWEESGLHAQSEALIFAGLLDFHFPAQPDWRQRCHVFCVQTWQNSPCVTTEMAPEWFASDALPYARMWDDNRYWLPHVLDGCTVNARFTFAADNATVADFEMSVT